MANERLGRLAIRGGAPVRDASKHWPKWPVFDDAERKALNDVLESGKWWYGERVRQFERDYAHFQDARHCVTCTSGTTAAEICFQALGLKQGDEVIVPPYTFIATASTVARMGGTPVFADVDDSWCLSPAAVEAAITPRTKAIVPVHFGGRIADMDKLNYIAKKHGLVILEDACHAWGSKWRDKGAGSLGLAGIFSFQVSKNITAGEGGAIVSDEEVFADSCRSISNCGRPKGSAWYKHTVLGTNARMNEFSAALLSAQLGRLGEQTRLREKNAALLNTALAEIEGLTPQPGDERITRRGYHLYCVRIDPDAFGCTRAQFVKAAEAEGLPLGVGYELPVYEQPVFKTGSLRREYTRCECPVAEDLCYTSGCWFTHTVLLGTDDDMQDIIAGFRKIKDHVADLKEE